MSDEIEHPAYTRGIVNEKLKPVKSITIREHFENVMAMNPVVQGYTGDVYCLYCNEENHEPDCPWAAAKAFLERGCVS